MAQDKSWLQRFRESESSTSVIFGAIVVIVVGILLFNYSRSNNSEISEEGMTETTTVMSDTGYELPATHTVELGETLWSISKMYYGTGFNWVDIVEANQLASSDDIEVGQTLTIPVVTSEETMAEETTEPTETATVSVDQMAPADEVVMNDSTSESAPAETTTTISGNSYTVVAGDSLWKIAQAKYNDGYAWTKVYEENKGSIIDPDLIYPGQVLTLPQ